MGESNQDTDNKNKNFSTTCENQMTRFILKFFKKQNYDSEDSFHWMAISLKKINVKKRRHKRGLLIPWAHPHEYSALAFPLQLQHYC